MILNNRYLLVIAMLLVSLLISGISGCGNPENNIVSTNALSVSISNHTFNVEIADTDAERAKGLMGRESMSNSSGMLFVYTDEDTRGFWMRDTLITLDMIFIDKDMKIVDINRNAQPCADSVCPVYYSKSPAQYILEINGGLGEALSITIGDKVKIAE